jgi:glutamate-1-semialdehyde 2,1-aminomutase
VRSAAAFEKAKRVLVGGVNSPVRAFAAVGGTPIFVQRAEGPYVYDVDENRYVDLICSWGATIVGHAHPKVVETVRRAAANGLSFGTCCAAEGELAETIIAALPSIEQVRFVSSGTEAAMSAIRLARAATGRVNVVKFAGCYHGHVDSLLVAAGSGAATLGKPDSAGVPQAFAETALLAPYNNLAAVEGIMSDQGQNVAAVIVEPLAGNMGFVLPAEGFLVGLRRLCDRHGCLLIFDEVMTGFRVAWGGYQSICGIQPDITCLGKVIGGGMPVAAYGGPRALMRLVSPEGPMYQAGTLSGNPVAMAAGLTTLELCRKSGFYASLEAAARRVAEGLGELGRRAGIAVQTGACGGMLGLAMSARDVTDFDEARKADGARFRRFFHAMLDRGVLLPPSPYEAFFLSAAHDESVIDQVLSAAGEAFRSIAS